MTLSRGSGLFGNLGPKLSQTGFVFGCVATHAGQQHPSGPNFPVATVARAVARRVLLRFE